MNEEIGPNLEQVLQVAGEYYEIHQQQAAAAEEKRQQEETERHEKELAEARAFMANFMPPSLIPYVDLTYYSHKRAGELDHFEDQGLYLWLEVPNAFPVRFKVRRFWNGAAQQFDLSRASGGPFEVPLNGIVLEDDGHHWIGYSWGQHFDHLLTAVGCAIMRHREQGDRLQQELQTAEAEAAKLAELEALGATLAPGQEPTAEERIATALEAIATAAAAWIGV